MKIDRIKAEKVFRNYVSAYNAVSYTHLDVYKRQDKRAAVLGGYPQPA